MYQVYSGQRRTDSNLMLTAGMQLPKEDRVCSEVADMPVPTVKNIACIHHGGKYFHGTSSTSTFKQYHLC
jgi:N-acetyl-beta-hexosaminidase